MSTTTLTIDCSGISADDLVYDGTNSENDGLLAIQTPALVARIEYAPPSRYMDGATAVDGTWDQSAINATVHLKAADAGSLRAKKAALKAALGQFRYQVTTDENGDVDVWEADMGSLLPVNDSLDFNDMLMFSRVYRIQIPVKPNPVS